MISTRLGVAIATAIAVVLAVLVVLTGGGSGAAVDRTLVPGFASDEVVALAWRGEAGAVRVVRDPTSTTGWTIDPRGAAHGGRIEDAFAALRGAKWQRRRAGAPPGGAAPVATLTVERRAGEPLVVVVHRAPDADEQRWLSIGDRALLVDAWIARALAPAPVALRVGEPLAGAPSASELRVPIGDRRFALRGTPRRIVEPFPLWLDPTIAHQLERALSALSVVALPDGAVAPGGAAITVDQLAATVGGPCPGHPELLAIDGTYGPGCIEPRAWDAARAAIDALARPPAQIVERRPVPIDPARIQLADRGVLDLTAGARIGDREADPARAAELVLALAAPAEPVALPTSPPIGALEVTDRGGQAIAIDLYAGGDAGGVVARRGEPVALKIGQGAWALLTRPSSELADPTPWREEPTTISQLELGGTRYTRGEVLGEWTRSGPGRDDPAAVDQLARLLAQPHATRRPRAVAARRTITVHVAPVGGAAQVHTVALGAPDAAGCPAVIDGAPLELDAQVCALVQTLVGS